MRFSTGSSSSSLASDSLSRKSTLCIYTEVDAPAPAPAPYERMDSSSEAMELRRELEAVKSALQQQSEAVLKQRHQLVEAGQTLAARDKQAVQERRLRQDQLALVLRSLVLLESRLTREQKQIHVTLRQKEKIIKTQQEEINKLKARKTFCSNCQQVLGFTSEQTNIETDPEFQSLESTDSRFQNNFVRSCSYREINSPPAFQKNTRLSKSFQLPKNEIVYGNSSSSEEGNNVTVGNKGTFIKNKQAFVRRDVFRRSRKYSGRRNSKYVHSNQLKEYNNTAANNSSSAEDCIGMSYQVNNDENDFTANQIAKDIRQASLKIDQLIGEAAKKELQNNTTDSNKTYSTKIETLHGINRQASDEIKANRQLFLNNVLNEEGNEKPWYCNVSDPEQDTDGLNENNLLISVKSKSADNILINDDNVIHTELISAKNETLCNSLLKSSRNDIFSSKLGDGMDNLESDLTKPISATEISETWYASASDADECPSNEIYKNNPVLECVNQILLQNSLDDSSNDNSKSSETPSPKATAKRVQFSTLNSISYDDSARSNSNNHMTHTLPRLDKRANKIVKFSLETASEHSYEVPNTAQGFQYEVQSIYSNEYEPIITKCPDTKPVPLPRTVISNEKSNVPNIKGSVVKSLAANIESRNNKEKKIDDCGSMKIFNKRKVPRTPPALPPKPKNLSAKWKAETAIISTTALLDSETVAANQRVADVKMRKIGQVATMNAIEPDYCSISEINVSVVSNGKRELLLSQPTVEIHNEQYPAHTMNHKNSMAKVISLPRIQNKISDKDIPKLPQVTEIIIPDDDDKPNEDRSFQQTTDSYLTNFNIQSLQPKIDSRASIQMGNTVSTILSEINKGAKCNGKKINLTELDRQFNVGCQKTQPKNNNELHKTECFEDINKFDLSQNFEEFKIEDELGNIVAEEYRISSESSDGSMSDIVTEHVISTVPDRDIKHDIDNSNDKVKDDTFQENINRIVLKRGLAKNAKMTNKPDLLSNIENLETESVRNSDIESSNSSGSNSGSYNTVKCEPRMVLNNNIDLNRIKNINTFDFFLETSGLSSKSIITNKNYLGLRPPSANHKSVLKPKDIKTRAKNPITTNKINEKPMTTAIKYFEPYV